MANDEDRDDRVKFGRRTVVKGLAAATVAGGSGWSLNMAQAETTSKADIEAFLTQQILYWNTGKQAEMKALYAKHSPNGLVIEFVGSPIGDGWKMFQHMWDTYAGTVRTDIKEIMVNGEEGACYLHNVRVATGLVNPSIEIYNFADGRLHIRYFHRSAAVTDTPPPAH